MGCSIWDDARTSLKMESKTRNPVLQTHWNGKLLPTQITAFSPAALCSHEHSWSVLEKWGQGNFSVPSGKLSFHLASNEEGPQQARLPGFCLFFQERTSSPSQKLPWDCPGG